MENNLLDPKKIHVRLVYLLENWRVEEAIERAVTAWEMVAPGEETDLLRCLVGAEDNLPMSEDELFELRKIALDLAEEYRESQLQEVGS
jgi:hypothetical protein